MTLLSEQLYDIVESHSEHEQHQGGKSYKVYPAFLFRRYGLSPYGFYEQEQKSRAVERRYRQEIEYAEVYGDKCYQHDE